MRVYINLDSSEFVASTVLTQRVNTLYFTRRDTVPVEVQVVRGGSVVELGAGATGQIGIKKTFTGNFLANDTAWTKTGTGAATVYTFDLNLNTANMDAEFSPDATTESVTAKIEVTWSVSGTTTTTLPTSAVVYNDVIRGGEPAVSPGNTSFTLQSPNTSTWSVSIDNDGVLTATKIPLAVINLAEFFPLNGTFGPGYYGSETFGPWPVNTRIEIAHVVSNYSQIALDLNGNEYFAPGGNFSLSANTQLVVDLYINNGLEKGASGTLTVFVA